MVKKGIADRDARTGPSLPTAHVIDPGCSGSMHHRALATPRHPAGFSLVITLMLMALIVIVGIGMLQLATISLRANSVSESRAIARANARMALQLAIAQLQKEMGPDQRISAPASLGGVSGGNRNWTAAWTPGIPDPSGLIPATGWGVHHGGHRHFTDLRAATPNWRTDWRTAQLVTNNGESTGKTISVGELADATPVDVPLIGTQRGGGVAWWTEDLSQRASLAAGVNGSDAREQGLASAPRADAGMLQTSGGWVTDFFAGQSERAKTVTLKSFEVGRGGNLKGLDSPAGTRSYGLFTDPVQGGFKKDLSRFVESDDPTFGRLEDFGLVGINGDDSILTEPFHRNSGPRWDLLREWFRLRERIGNGPGAVVDSQPPTQTRQTGVFGGEGVAVDAIRETQPPLQPVMIDGGFHWDFTPETNSHEAIRCHIYPRLTLWNPYDKPLRTRGLIVCMPKHVESGGGLSLEVRDAAGSQRVISEVIRGWGHQFRGAGEPAPYHYFMFMVEETVFAPGECLVFTPRVGPQGSALYSGTNVAANLLTASQPVGHQNFHIRHAQTNTELVKLMREGGRVARYVTTPTTGSFNQFLLWNPKPFLLKSSRGNSASFSQVLTGADFPTLQRLYVNDGGGGENYLAGDGKRSSYVRVKPGWNNDAVNMGQDWATFSSNPQRIPPRMWHYRVRLSRIDESAEPLVVGRENNPQPPHEAAIFADWNPLSRVICRTPSTYYHNFFDLHVGPWFLCKAPYAAHGPDQDWSTFDFTRGVARGCPFADPRSAQASGTYPLAAFPSADLPLQSIGTLRHVPLSPWVWHPSRVIGSSRPSLHSKLTSTSLPEISSSGNPWKDILFQRDAVFDDLIQIEDSKDDVLLYDISFEVNRRLWDSFFASAWSADQAWDGLERLPNRQHVTHPLAADALDRIRSPGSLADWLPSVLLVHEGAFNVNSTSREAWASVLAGIIGLPRTDAAGSPVSGEIPYSRFPEPPEIKSPWNGDLNLDRSEILTLAGHVADIVRERGPFLGVADFVNRRLAADASGNRGSLDEAIFRSGFNTTERRGPATYKEGGTDTQVADELRAEEELAADSRLSGASTYLEQGDLLEAIGGQLVARGDTFRIRAVGVSPSRNGSEIREVCEAVVVRRSDYVAGKSLESAGGPDEGNSALVPPMVATASGSKMEDNPRLDPINRRFGRRFEILEFRWIPNLATP